MPRSSIPSLARMFVVERVLEVHSSVRVSLFFVFVEFDFE